jgi:hypothetical protein
MNAPAYTLEEMNGKFICSFISLCGKRPVLDCVRRSDNDKPYLYSSKEEAQNDENYDQENDKIIPAEDFFK